MWSTVIDTVVSVFLCLLPSCRRLKELVPNNWRFDFFHHEERHKKKERKNESDSVQQKHKKLNKQC